MRILVVTRRRTESGAIAVLSVLLVAVLLGMAAFTLDFGTAYVAKRQLQTGADSAALAAASVYAQADGKCQDIVNEASANYASLLDAAQKAADKMLEGNVSDSMLQSNLKNVAGSTIKPACNSSGQLFVDYSATAATNTTLGRLFGTQIVGERRTAQATVEVPQSALGARPYAICSSDIASGAFPSAVTMVSFPGTGGSGAACDTLSGDWWTIQCPGEPKNLAAETKNGCKNPIDIVPGQDSHKSTPADLSDYLLNSTQGCGGGYSSSCLQADTGNNFTQNAVLKAWNQQLLGKTIVLPVFCGGTVCDPDALSGNGGGGKYPVHRLVTVTVCGFHFNKAQPNSSASPANQTNAGLCANNPNGYDAVADTSNDKTYLLVVFTHVQVSGSTSNSTCGQGGGQCDNGQRMTLLTR